MCFTSPEGLETEFCFQKSALMSFSLDAKVHPSTTGRDRRRRESESVLMELFSPSEHPTVTLFFVNFRFSNLREAGSDAVPSQRPLICVSLLFGDVRQRTVDVQVGDVRAVAALQGSCKPIRRCSAVCVLSNLEFGVPPELDYSRGPLQRRGEPAGQNTCARTDEVSQTPLVWI